MLVSSHSLSLRTNMVHDVSVYSLPHWYVSAYSHWHTGNEASKYRAILPRNIGAPIWCIAGLRTLHDYQHGKGSAYLTDNKALRGRTGVREHDGTLS